MPALKIIIILLLFQNVGFQDLSSGNHQYVITTNAQIADKIILENYTQEEMSVLPLGILNACTNLEKIVLFVCCFMDHLQGTF